MSVEIMTNSNPQPQVRDNRTEKRYFVDNVILDHYGQKLGPYGLAVYMALCRFADKDDQDCFPSQETIAKLTGMSKPKVIDRLKLLKKLGLIDWHHRKRKDGGQTSNMYYLFDPPVNEVNSPSKSQIQGGVNGVNTNNPHEEQSSNEEPNGASDAPANLNDWLEVLRESSNRPAILRWMISVLYPYYKEDDLPSYGYIGKVANEMGGAGLLAKWVWRVAEYEPQGNLISYIRKASKSGGSNERRRKAPEHDHNTPPPDELKRLKQLVREQKEKREAPAGV